MNLIRRDRPAPIDLWEAFDGLRGEMDRALDLFDAFGRLKSPDAAGLLDRPLAPAVDLVETPEEFILTADLPGVDRSELEISVTGTVLSIKGERREEKKAGSGKQYRKETWSGSFQRTLDLPAQADPDRIGAELKDGILSLRIAKREEAKPKLISVAVK